MSRQTEITFTSNVLVEQETKLSGPQTTSKDPNERKLARSLRIQRRVNTLLEASRSEDLTEEDKPVGPINQQKAKCNKSLEKLILAAEQDLNELLIVNRSQELSRRDSENFKRQQILNKLEKEASDSQDTFNEIVEKWTNLQNYSDPLDIHNGIVNIKEKCDQLILVRDRIITLIKLEIEIAEKSFNIDQKKNFEDIEALFKRIDKYIATMKESFNGQFNVIKKVVDTVTNSYIKGRYDKWNEAYENVSNEIEELSNNRFRFIRKVTNALQTVISDFEEEFRDQKSKLLCNLNTSRQDFEQIKVEVLLNSQMYDYNFQILERRCNESTIAGAERKRKINKLRDIITNLKRSIESFTTTIKEKIKKHIADIKYVHQQIIDIENKADNFANTNDKIFHEIWNLNKASCQKILDKIMATDKILHEQQMSVVWQPPTDTTIEIMTLPSFRRAMSFVSIFNQIPGSKSVCQYGSKWKCDLIRPSAVETVKSPELSFLKTTEAYKKLLKKILMQTSDKAGFLTEKRIKELIKKYGDEEKSLIRLENIFESLNIQKQEDIDLMLNFFLPYSYCLICTEGEQDRESSTMFATQISDASFLSYTTKSIVDCDYHGEVLQLVEALRFTTHVRESIDEAVLEIVTSKVDLTNDFESEESLDIAKADLMDITQGRKSVKKKPTITVKERMACQYNHSLVISNVYLTRAFREFVEFYYNRTNTIIPTTGERLRKKRFTISRLLEEKDIVDYWRKWRSIYSEKSRSIMIWEGLATGIQYYLDVLKQRKLISEEVVKLRKQNTRLKKMVDSYKTHHRFLPPVCEIECVCATLSEPILNIKKTA